MIDILASGIIIHGNATGVWSPSHPHLLPIITTIPQTTLPYTPQVDDRYIPETRLTDENGNRIIF